MLLFVVNQILWAFCVEKRSVKQLKLKNMTLLSSSILATIRPLSTDGEKVNNNTMNDEIDRQRHNNKTGNNKEK